MERLTESDLNKVCYDPWELCGMDQYCSKGIYDEGGCTNGCHILKMYKKLAEYEDAEEQGFLLRLPCKIGDNVFCISSRYTLCSEYGEERDEYNCQGCEALECDSVKEYYIKDEINVSLAWIVSNIKRFGKTVFLTYEEAERKLKELQKDSVYNEQIS